MKLHIPIPIAIALDRTSRAPLHRQVFDALRDAIGKGGVVPGLLLPSTRGLARRLGVSRNTVLNAYEELAAAGLVEGKTGSGTAVRGCVRPPRMPDPRNILRRSHYPVKAVPLRDPDGNSLYLHGTIV